MKMAFAFTCVAAIVAAVLVCPCQSADPDPGSLAFSPVIGVMDQPSDGSDSTYILTTVVSYLEMAGATVVPIHYRTSAEELVRLLRQINGVFLPGGHVDFTSPSSEAFFEASRVVYEWAAAENARGEVFPLWGTCQGFQQLAILAANSTAVLCRKCSDSDNLLLPLNFTAAALKSRMLSSLSPALLSALQREPITANFHVNGVPPAAFAPGSALAQVFVPLSTNLDRKGWEFVSTMEGRSLPFYAVQWHPEAYLNPSAHSVAVSQALANFFALEARRSTHRFDNRTQNAPKDLRSCRPLRPTPVLRKYLISMYVFDSTQQCVGWEEGARSFGGAVPPSPPSPTVVVVQ
eukprot:RCo050386